MSDTARKSSPLGPILIGLGGVVVLLALGSWQMQRLAWKEGVIASAEARMRANPVALPVAIDAATLDYLPVSVEGQFAGDSRINFLTSMKPYGPGYGIIDAFETDDGRRILVDRGFAPHSAPEVSIPSGPQSITGVLRWPDDTNAFTPDPDLKRREWFAHDIDSMAQAAGTERLYLVARPSGEVKGWPRPRPQQVQLPNNHLNYALTWFGLAAVWAVMSVLWLRSRRKLPAT